MWRVIMSLANSLGMAGKITILVILVIILLVIIYQMISYQSKESRLKKAVAANIPNERILFKFICYSKDITLEMVKEWCAEVSNCFTPERMRGVYISNQKSCKYNKKKLYNGLEKELNSQKTLLSLFDEKNRFTISKNAQENDIATISLIIDKSLVLVVLME